MTAIISPCGTYRYSLTRSLFRPGFKVCVVMVNPSTADSIEDDATIRKLMGFGRRLQWSEFTVVNLFAYRATDVRELADAVDPIGPYNDHHIMMALAQCDILVVAWGANAKLPLRFRDRWRSVIRTADVICKRPYCFDVCKDGHPAHPVMLPYGGIQLWEPPL